MSPTWSATDRGWMQRALALAEQGRGAVAPNPMVGAVLVSGGRRVSEGWHRRLGGPHAEVECLRGVDRNLASACTLLVTLEPCDHQGRTPPCTQRILDAGIPRVVVAMADPNPLVSGRGLARLAAAGVDVSVGLLGDEARRLNRGFVSHMERGRPWITLKWAQSLDGFVTRRAGTPTDISGKESGERTALLRAAHRGILVGSGTALADNPLLDLRELEAVPPLRIVLDSRAQLPPASRLVATLPGLPLLVVCGRNAPQLRVAALRAEGARVLQDAEADAPRLSWLLPQLPSLGVDSLLVEGGPRIHRAFLAEGAVDELVVITSPHTLGEGLPAWAEGSALPDAARTVASQWVGGDHWRTVRLDRRP
jgi:diaminohydroxyphosphoribosylaminopyrimidine deaminase/5-amino-6-(5-phosphoribosylamino)uracil reductase